LKQAALPAAPQLLATQALASLLLFACKLTRISAFRGFCPKVLLPCFTRIAIPTLRPSLALLNAALVIFVVAVA
jgi:hypothetical protein